jgi:hemoglobin
MRIAVFLIVTLLAGCATFSSPKDQLYRDLGEQSGIEQIVDGLLDNIARDDRIFDVFKDTKIEHLRTMLIEQFCNLSGGPCEYTGVSMEKSHGGLHITEAQFNALVEDLILAMEHEHISVSAQNRLLALLAPMRPQIIHI